MSIAISCFLASILASPAHAEEAGKSAKTNRSFEIYIETNFIDQPDFSCYGAKKLRVIYRRAFWEKREDRQQLPNKQRVIDFAKKKYGDYTGLLVPDIEHWKLGGSDTQVCESVQKLVTVLEWIKSGAPKAKVGYYGRPPKPDKRAKLDPSHRRYKEWQQHNDKLTPLAKAQDALFPVMYTATDNRELWVKVAVRQISEAKRLGKGKPVYGFINPFYHNVAAAREIRRKPIHEITFCCNLRP